MSKPELNPDRLHVQINSAVSAADRCKRWRDDARHRVPKGPERDGGIDQLLAELSLAMAPLRSALGRLRHEPQPDELEQRLRAASKRLQRERRALKKMRSTDPHV